MESNRIPIRDPRAVGNRLRVDEVYVETCSDIPDHPPLGPTDADRLGGAAIRRDPWTMAWFVREANSIPPVDEFAIKTEADHSPCQALEGICGQRLQ